MDLKITSPIDDAVVGTVPALDASGVDAVLSKLEQGFADWSAKPPVERDKVLQTMAGVLRDNVDQLAELLTREIAKTPAETKSEIIRSADLIDCTISEAAKLADYEIKAEDFPNTKPGRVQRVTRQPLGVVLAISPFNFPVNLAVSKIAPALLAGNTVVWKPSTQGAVTSRRLAELWQAAGVPEDILGVVTGRSDEIGDHLVTHPFVKMVAMTGSTAVGQRIAKQTGMIPLMLELGGNDPAIVLEDADFDLAARCIVQGAFKYTGQRCTAVKRVYVVEPAADRLVAAIVAETKAAFGSAGDPRRHPVGPVISDRQADYLAELLAEAGQRGKIVHGGERDGRVFTATVVDGLPPDARLVTEEQFGPLLPIVRVYDADEAVSLANDSEYGLQASVFSGDSETAAAIGDRLEVGGVHLNGPDQRGPDNFLFIGHKHSGLMPQGIRFSLEGMSRLKGIVSNH